MPKWHPRSVAVLLGLFAARLAAGCGVWEGSRVGGCVVLPEVSSSQLDG